MQKPVLLDLFCGAGGAAMGYYRAGFEVVGVDINTQPHYPFEFHQGDALEYCAEHGKEFDVIHASPPCQGYTVAKQLALVRNKTYPDYPLLIKPLHNLLVEINKPYIIENVTGAKRDLRSPVMLCGKYFGLKVYRHRWFEISPFILTPSHEPHRDKTPTAGHGVSPKGFISVCGHGGVQGFNNKTIIEKWSESMEIDWMGRKELAEAIPPAYTEFIGKQLLKMIRSE